MQIIGSTAANLEEYRALLRTVAAGRLKPVIDSVYAMDDAHEALARMERAEQFGNVKIEPRPDSD